jgi:RHS repeat-associated protein
MTEMANISGTWQWAHTNVMAPGLSATYDADLTGQTEGPLYFHLTDWLGTRRQQTDYAGNPVLNFTGLPYGDGLTTIPVSTADVADATEHHFTGKERDSESGNDYFGARYYASSMGRFMSPDPMMASAKIWDPQTWNRYSYARNNPLMMIDPTGEAEVTAAQCAQDKSCVTVNVNVIYDKNSNGGKGLTDDQKAAFNKGQLQNAKDQYGNADIHLNVTYTAGSLSTSDGKTMVSGIQAGALNVMVTDQVGTAVSGMAGKTAVSFINANSTDNEDLPHEMSHQFMGDTRSWMNAVSSHDPSGISGLIFNAIQDVGNDSERMWMNHLDQRSGPMSYYPLASAYHHNAEVFQRYITPTAKPQ